MKEDKLIKYRKNRKRRLIISIIVFVIGLILARESYIIMKNVDHVSKLGFRYKPGEEYLILKEVSGNEVDGEHFVEVYQKSDKLIVNAYSDFKVDKPNQSVHKLDYMVKSEDIKITWLDFIGNEIDRDSNLVQQVKVDIYNNGEAIISEKFNFMEKGVEEIDDYFNQKNH